MGKVGLKSGEALWLQRAEEVTQGQATLIMNGTALPTFEIRGSRYHALLMSFA